MICLWWKRCPCNKERDASDVKNGQLVGNGFPVVLINRFAWEKGDVVAVASHHEEEGFKAFWGIVCLQCEAQQRVWPAQGCLSSRYHRLWVYRDALSLMPASPLRVGAMMNRMSRSRRPSLWETTTTTWGPSFNWGEGFQRLWCGSPTHTHTHTRKIRKGKNGMMR